MKKYLTLLLFRINESLNNKDVISYLVRYYRKNGNLSKHLESINRNGKVLVTMFYLTLIQMLCDNNKVYSGSDVTKVSYKKIKINKINVNNLYRKLFYKFQNKCSLFKITIIIRNNIIEEYCYGK